MSSQRILSGLLVTAALIFPAASPQRAAAQLVDFFDVCTEVNCGAVNFLGQYRLDNSGFSIPFETEILSDGGECLRVDMLTDFGGGAANLEAVLVAPNGVVWRNNDGNFRGECPQCPLVKANTTVPGWYTLQIGHYNGTGSAANFAVAYGRYNSGNPNCIGPTPREAPERQAVKPVGSEPGGGDFTTFEGE